jgi:hypothetical protein
VVPVPMGGQLPLSKKLLRVELAWRDEHLRRNRYSLEGIASREILTWRESGAEMYGAFRMTLGGGLNDSIEFAVARDRMSRVARSETLCCFFCRVLVVRAMR